MVDRELPCGRCNERVPIKTLRYEKTGTNLICPKCRGEEEQPRKSRVEPLVGGPFGGAKTLKYQCPNCRYTFRRSPTHPVKQCPNCGGKKLVRYKKVSADDVLKIADDDRF